MISNTQPLPPRLNTAKAAEYLGISPHTLNRKRSLGGGPTYIKRGHKVFYEIPALDEWDKSLEEVRTSTRGKS